MSSNDLKTASDSVDLSQAEAVVSSVGSYVSVEGLSQLLAPLEEGEVYARQVLQNQWFRGLSALKTKANFDKATLVMLQKHTTGAVTANGDEEEEEEQEDWKNGGQQRGSVAGMDKFSQDRRRGQFLYEECMQREELEWEEFAEVSQLHLFMEENLERVAQVEESMTMLQLVHDVMKPKARQRYIYAWGIVTTVSPPPAWSEVERIRCSQRHKPAYMRFPPPTCRIPIVPDPFWKPWELPAPPVGLIQAPPEA
ncbi:uncharacterized protein Tco025E_04207 [Trypanosoma conorhini]|uniref:Uncharacterized protein n=1 Tax=Trypanosoma conorhini TaxID=83891 RepID=A0A422PNP2_9TRYP|nr:uncharacterized protein Tco025E_04207 [Trypanosoma conorhini]RNF19343.1 hypothetical protein Tco025E_04207 [Trypanosoma conorhini]